MSDEIAIGIILTIGILAGLYDISHDEPTLLWRGANLFLRMSLVVTAFHFAIQERLSLFIFGCFLSIFALVIPYDPPNNTINPRSNPTNQTQAIDLKEMIVVNCVHKNTHVKALEYTGENFQQILQMMIDVYGTSNALQEEVIKDKQGNITNKFLMSYGGHADRMIKVGQFVVFEEDGIEVYTRDHFAENYDVLEQ